MLQSQKVGIALERKGVFNFAGSDVTLVGPELKPGDRAPDFQVTANDLSQKSLRDFLGQALVISVVPSLDTGVCDAQTRKFNETAGELSGLKVLTVSCDLPFAQKRWCGAAGVENVVTLSDHRDVSFGQAYGVLIREHRLLARAVFVVDPSGMITYVEYVPAAGQHPNYDAAIAAAQKLR